MYIYTLYILLYTRYSLIIRVYRTMYAILDSGQWCGRRPHHVYVHWTYTLFSDYTIRVR